VNAEQKERVKAVIAEDATGTGRLVRIVDNKPLYCVMGGLGHAIGITHKQMKGAGEVGFTKGAWARVQEEYGLTSIDAHRMIGINDILSNLEDRRAALIAWVDARPTV